jgi:hypothetical protein
VAFQARHEGLSNLGRLFQSVEYRTNNATVGGSSPSSTIFAVCELGIFLVSGATNRIVCMSPLDALSKMMIVLFCRKKMNAS